MRGLMRLRAHALAGLMAAVALLTGCSSTDKQMNVCPRVAVLTEAGKLTRFDPGPGRDILDINFQADIGDLVAACQYPDSKHHRRVLVQVTPIFVVERGSANTDRQATFTYFISVVRNGEILSKQPFELSAEFAGNRSRTILRDDNPPIVVDIPLAYKAAEYEYEILVGFQLTAEELEYNQRWQGLGR